MRVLQFSGGVDSLACLLLAEGKLTVLTVITDGGDPGLLGYMDRVMAAFPQHRFVIKHSQRHIKQFGQPVDVVPLRWTPLGQLIRGTNDIRYQDSFSCCNRAIWQPLDRLSRELGATEIIRGQRNDDDLRDPVKSGTVIDGVTINFPLADWTRQRVMDFVRATAPTLMPPGYDHGEKTSRDCWDCTAYLGDNQQRIANLPPYQRGRVNALIKQWRADVLAELGE
jgi:3'-phosphoadenosine 5'-phosphosulfate sulfotransferase (PAPS reductase)/FAD synthetase